MHGSAVNGRSAGLHPAFPDAVVIVDAQGTIVQANARAVALFGSVEGQLSGTAIHSLFPGQHVPFPCAGWRRRMHADRYAELMGNRGDGSKFRAGVAVMPLQADGGAAAVITVRDLTEERETQFILEQGLELLRTVISCELWTATASQGRARARRAERVALRRGTVGAHRRTAAALTGPPSRRMCTSPGANGRPVTTHVPRRSA